MNTLGVAATAVTLTLLLGACSPSSDVPDSGPTTNDAYDIPSANAAAEYTRPNPPAASVPDDKTSDQAASQVVTLAGLGALRIGQPVPKGTDWAERGAQVPGGCRTVSSPDHPGVYAIVTEGRVRRITVGKRSDVKLVEGIGVGATEADVRKWFTGFRETPHAYEDALAKYLTAPNAASGDAALRFEIGRDGKVSLTHAGTMPVLASVEGCS